jgi:uncharacterized protein (DUF934 family)
MPLLKGGRFVPDGWHELAEGEAAPDGGAVVVPLARLLGEATAFTRFGGALGVRIGPDQRVEQVEPWLPRLSLVVLTFPVFSDGRAFSAARILRERYAFRGEVDAAGDVQVDRYQFMRQCGFDAFEIASERAGATWARAEMEMGLTYQPDYAEPHGAEAVWRARQARQALAAE